MAAAEIKREDVLSGHFLLRYLRPDELRQLAANANLVRRPAHTTIFQKGDPGDSLMAVFRGRVKICTYSGDGRELVLNIIDHGGLFGEIALLDGEPRTADAVTIEETDILVLERSRLLPFLTANPEITIRLISVICKRLRQTSEHLEDALLREAPSRLARGLLRLAGTFGRPSADGLRLNIRLSQQQMGNLVGISRESINKYIVDWTRAGHLAVQSRFITIRDREAIERIAEADI